MSRLLSTARGWAPFPRTVCCTPAAHHLYLASKSNSQLFFPLSFFQSRLLPARWHLLLPQPRLLSSSSPVLHPASGHPSINHPGSAICNSPYSVQCYYYYHRSLLVPLNLPLTNPPYPHLSLTTAAVLRNCCCYLLLRLLRRPGCCSNQRVSFLLFHPGLPRFSPLVSLVHAASPTIPHLGGAGLSRRGCLPFFGCPSN